jgi:carbon storage regulator CsrA
MLTLSRKQNESITIGDDIVVTVVEVRGDKVRLGLVVPKEKSVHRQEIWQILQEPWPRATLDPDWLTWKDGSVLRLARTIADKGDYEARPILADALEDAGCADAAILDHCRTCGRDARRSWVVDLILSRS